ncbi:MAG: hypothetical protein PHY56_00045 [Candidatus Omnitrophica bacterium]|nr:hypothetical protein [Candidatus Omnitrophota bacterium]
MPDPAVGNGSQQVPAAQAATTGTQVKPEGEKGAVGTEGGEKEKGAKVDVTKLSMEEINKLTPEQARTYLADLAKEHVNLQKLYGTQTGEVGALRKKAKVENLLETVFNGLNVSTAVGPGEGQPAVVEKPAESKPAVTNNQVVFDSLDKIDAQFDIDCQEKDVPTAIKLKDRRLEAFRRIDTDRTVQISREKDKANEILSDFMFKKDADGNIIPNEENQLILESYVNGLPPDVRQGYQILMQNKPIFVKELINAALGKASPEILKKVRAAGAQGALNGIEAAGAAGVAAAGGSGTIQETPEQKTNKELLAAKDYI